jgi:hypothetical protein
VERVERRDDHVVHAHVGRELGGGHDPTP